MTVQRLQSVAAVDCGVSVETQPLYLQLQQMLADAVQRPPADAEAKEFWRHVDETCSQLLDQGKDLWLLVQQALARTALGGFVPLSEALAEIEFWVTHHWDELHPLPDPEDTIPYRRLNALEDLASTATARVVRQAPVCTGPTLTLRSVQLALGDLEGEKFDPDDMDRTLRQSRERDPAAMQQTLDAAQAGVMSLRAIDAAQMQHVSRAEAVDLRPLVVLLDRVRQTLEPLLGGPSPALDTEPSHNGHAAAGPQGAGSSTANPQPSAAGVNNRDDVVRAIDQICAYYTQHEPTSPVPLLLHRARRLVRQDFLGVLRDLHPEAASAICTLAGLSPSQASDDD